MVGCQLYVCLCLLQTLLGQAMHQIDIEVIKARRFGGANGL